MKPRLFIGSSVESLEIAYALQEALDFDVEATVWTQGIFELSKATLTSLLEALDGFDFAAFVLSSDDATRLREKTVLSTRDNVILELGLFAGSLGIDRTFWVTPRGVPDLYIPTDLLGITPATYNPDRSDRNLKAALGPAANQIRRKVRSFGSREVGLKSFIVNTYPRSQHPAFFSEVEQLIPQAKNITLIAIGLNLLWEKHIVDLLIERAASGEASVRVCMGNPYNPHVQDRLIEEEMSGNRAPVGREGIARNVRALVQRLQGAGNPPAFSFTLFEHYPTFATLIFDDELFIYPYSYQELGNVSPIMHFRNDTSEEAQFFLANAERVLRDAVPADQIVLSTQDSQYFSNDWILAAVYAIPDGSEPLYEFGTSILGYDVRHKECSNRLGAEVNSEIRQYVGEASRYGFHLTLADALFFATRAHVNRLRAELFSLAEEFHPLELTNLRIVDNLGSDDDVVILCDDETGAIEALHHELVSRAYRSAISSTYLTGFTTRSIGTTKPKRDRLMMQRYRSPHVLNEFVPHFTLLSEPPSEPTERSTIVEHLRDRFSNQSVPKDITIKELCLMGKSKESQYWEIVERFPLTYRLN